MSLLGASAYLPLTRFDVVIHIAALPRFNHRHQVVHARRVNAVVRWAERNAVDLVSAYNVRTRFLADVGTYLDKAYDNALGAGDTAFRQKDDHPHCRRRRQRDMLPHSLCLASAIATAMRGCVVIHSDMSSFELLDDDGTRSSRMHVLRYGIEETTTCDAFHF